MKIIKLADLHFGYGGNSLDWQNIQFSYIENIVLPFIEENTNPDTDIITLEGDIFHKQDSIDTVVKNKFTSLLNQMRKILPVHIIVGNHDIYREFTTDVNALKEYAPYSDVYLYENPKLVTFRREKDYNVYFCPWRCTDEDIELALIEANNSDIYNMVCHGDFKDLRLNAAQIIKHGMDVNKLNNIPFVTSGHIHLRQQKKNLTMLGCPYMMDKNDINNEKGFWVLDTSNDSLTFHQNDYSPKFLKLEYSKIKDMDEKIVENMFKNNKIDILVDYTDTTVNQQNIVDKYSSYGAYNFEVKEILKKDKISVNGDDVEIDESAEYTDTEFNIVSLFDEILDKDDFKYVDLSDEDKNYLKNKNLEIYSKLMLS